jgi:predicted phosphatase
MKDLAEERGHTLCVQFLSDPAKAYLEDRRLHNNEVAEGLGMLMFTGVAVDPRATKGKRKKVFSFLSKPKEGFVAVK